ncbi:hypothetical protein MHU86_4308 [Fragilaria crotonensis]|nr:hypothetical protein MHU86_4308 [Fragilaria crotonensis]
MKRNDVLDAKGSKTKSLPIYFGVVGEGRYKKILSFGSISSISEDGNHLSWICEECKYENLDLTNRSCSMCGTRDPLSHSHAKKPTWDADSSDDDIRSLSTAPRRSIVRRGSSQSSARMVLAKLLETSFEDEITIESLATDLTTKDVLATSFAMLTIEGVGGWACPDCTFVNTRELHLTCGVCGRTKPPTSKDSSDVLQHTSLHEFLTQSMLTVGEQTSIDPQIHALLQFEEKASEKEYAATVIEQQREILRDATTRTENMSELRAILEEGEDTLKMLQRIYDDEFKEYETMVHHQAMRADEIELSEGTSPRLALSGYASVPGAHRISAQVLQWQGQQQMLNDWECQLQLRKQEIDQLQSQQQEALRRLLQ